jgi:hypothetical protein
VTFCCFVVFSFFSLFASCMWCAETRVVHGLEELTSPRARVTIFAANKGRQQVTQAPLCVYILIVGAGANARALPRALCACLVPRDAMSRSSWGSNADATLTRDAGTMGYRVWENGNGSPFQMCTPARGHVARSGKLISTC